MDLYTKRRWSPLQTVKYSRAEDTPASVARADSLERRAEKLLGETTDGDESAASVAEQLDRVHEVTAALIAAAKRTIGADTINLPRLTDRQKEILAMLAADKRPEQIAAELYLSRRTVEWHIGNLREIFGECTYHGVVRAASTMGLV